MTTAPPSAVPLIRGYDNGGFLIAEKTYKGGILIDADFSITQWDRRDTDGLTFPDIAPLLATAEKPDLLLLGVGENMTHPFDKLRIASSKAGVPLEVQATPAICRTWNLLLSEGRRVALAALCVGARGADASRPARTTPLK